MILLPLTCYKYKYFNTNFLLFISLKYGWVIHAMLNNKVTFSLNMFIFGLVRSYFLTFHLKGFGFRFLKLKRSISVKLGFAHRFLIYAGNQRKFFYKSKSLIITSSRTNHNIRVNLLFIFLYYKRFAYKRLGIFFKGLYLKLKLSKKKNKF